MYSSLRLKLAIVSVTVVAMTLSSLSALFLYERETNTINREFQKDVDERAASIYRELSINFETLRSLAILFNGDNIPDHARFQLEAKQILSRHDDIKALEWIPRVKHADREPFITKNQKNYPGYQFRERNEQGEMIDAKERLEYFPVAFVAPLAGNETAVGFDIASTYDRLVTLKKSRDTGMELATSSIVLVQDSDGSKGFLAFLPVYRGDSSTVEARQKNLLGFVLGVYCIKDIFTSSALTNKAIGMQMTLVDKTSRKGPEILYRHRSRINAAINNNFTYRKDLPAILGRKWCLMAKPTTTYIESRRSVLPQMVFVIGLALMLLIIWYIRMSIQRTEVIKSLVTKKTNELVEANNKLELLSRSDKLTGIANRRMLDETLEKEWLRAIRTKSRLSFILIDIDFFKQYNDNYGHVMGDECLQKVAVALNNVSRRSSDLVARYGGEEFALILAGTDNATSVAEACRLAVLDLAIPHLHSSCENVVTISVGTCSCIPELTLDHHMLIKTADKALYNAKDISRNKVCEIELKGTTPNVITYNKLTLVKSNSSRNKGD
ncbi:diguanylate cyclase [Moritella sp. 24]|uniref:diguanylate cyclase domain-containing protein n=1 Tax=Moritella sp. 24 TaxID=2746230 RepID=UPI001BA74CC4|nr:diguanylate cyclase [Moritella sp. 24]QUM77132.1 diguanylate cyclase [Moritella sp. 24]